MGPELQPAKGRGTEEVTLLRLRDTWVYKTEV